MADLPSDQKGRGNLGLLKEPVTYLEPALWKRIAEAETPEEYYQSWLGLQCSMITGACNAILVLAEDGKGSYAPVAFWPKGLRGRKHFAKIIEEVVRKGKGVALRRDGEEEEGPRAGENIHIAYPVKVEGHIHGVAAVEIPSCSDEQLQSAMRQLQWGVAWIDKWLIRQSGEPEKALRKRLSAVLDLGAISLQEKGYKAAALSFVTEMATALACDRVSMGFVKKSKAHIEALSHSAQFGREMNLLRAIGEAMDESIDQQAILLYPDQPENDRYILRAHAALARQHNSANILTVPFVDHEGRADGALTLERSGGEPFSEESIALCDAVTAFVGPILDEKRRNDRLLLFKITDSLSEQLSRLTGPGHMGRKICCAALVILLLFLAVAKGTYKITSETVLEGALQRAVTAPFDGYLFDAFLRAGELVETDQVMASMDSRDLRLERYRWAGQKEQYHLEYRKAMAEGETATTKILEAQMQQADAQLQLLDKQLSRAEIKAPFEGLIVNGDLSQSLGAPIERGQILFEVAPLDSYRVILKVDEMDIRQLAAGQQGDLILSAQPAVTLPFSVVKITPVSEVSDGKNYFRVEAEFRESYPWLRPGMQGYGKVVIDRRRLIWIWTHEIFNWIRLRSWKWLP